MTALRLHGGSCTDVGLVRSVNEDDLLVDDERRIYVVADGMGGHRAGEVASHTAVATLSAGLAARTIWALVAGVREANTAVLEAAMADSELRGMGTTLCAVAVVLDEGDEERLGVVNVGDSRVYLLSGGVLTQLSEDHSLVEEMRREGRLTDEEADTHPRRNVITRALGVETGVMVDAWFLNGAPGDRLLLCSDGLVDEVPDPVVAEVLAAGADATATATELVERAKAAGGRDNITCVVVDVLEGPGEAAGTVADRLERVDTDPRAPEDEDEDEDGEPEVEAAGDRPRGDATAESPLLLTEAATGELPVATPQDPEPVSVAPSGAGGFPTAVVLAGLAFVSFMALAAVFLAR